MKFLAPKITRARPGRSKHNIRHRLLGLAIAQALACSAQAATIRVDVSTDGVVADRRCTLREALLNAHAISPVTSDCAAGEFGRPDRITFRSGLDPIVLTQGPLFISESIELYGNGTFGTTVSGNSSSRVFVIDSPATVEMRRMNVTGGLAVSGYGNGGGILVADANAHLILTDSTVSGNSGTIGAGIATGGSLTLREGTRITGNSAQDQGGGILQVCYDCDMLLTDSTVSNNSAETGGGIHGNGSNIQITRSTIEYNTAAIAGGIFSNNDLIIEANSTIFRNASTAGDAGGILAIGTLAVTDSFVSNNVAERDGGGIKFESGTAVRFENTTLENNQALHSGGALAVLQSDTVQLINSRVDFNTAAYDGGALAVLQSDTVQLINTRFAYNTATYDGGAVMSLAPLSVTDNSLLQSNSAAQGYGGSIYSSGGLLLNSAEILSNSAAFGGGVFAGDAEVRESLIAFNTAPQRGGGMMILGTLQMHNSTLSNNTSGAAGGGLQLEAGVGTTTQASLISGSTVTSNSSGDGGGITTKGSVEIVSSAISQNTATGMAGGGISNYGTLTLIGSTLDHNAALYGAGLFNSEVANILNSTLSGNQSSGYGGGIHNAHELNLYNATVVENSATSEGGGIGLFANGNVNMVNSVIARNSGGDCVDSGGTVNVNQNNFIGDGSCSAASVNGGSGDPMLGSLQDNGGSTLTHAPLSGSPLIETGDQPSCDGLVFPLYLSTDLDQALNPRSIDANADGLPACDRGAVEFIDIYPPTASWLSSGVQADNTEFVFEVVFRDVDGLVSIDSLGDDDVQVIGPDGFDVFAQLQQLSYQDASEVTAQYSFGAPGGTWGAEDTGGYEFSVANESVFDSATTGANGMPDTGLETLLFQSPEIEVRGNEMIIEDGDTTPSPQDNTDFEQVILGASQVQTYAIVNTGTRPLDIASIDVFGTGFALASTPADFVLPGQTEFFNVAFQPDAQAVSAGLITITSDDPDEGIYDFAIQGEGISPVTVDIAISGNGVDIDNQDMTPSLADGTEFDEVTIGQQLTHAFEIENQGEGILKLTDELSISGAGFTVTQQPLITLLGPKESTVAQITFTPFQEGEFGATVSLPNSDPDENPYEFNLHGAGTSNQAPTIEEAIFSVTDAARAGDFIGQISAEDPDGELPAKGAYAIVSGDPNGTFDLGDDGILSVADNTGLTGDIDLVVEVTDSDGQTASAIITIEVTIELLLRDSFEDQ